MASPIAQHEPAQLRVPAIGLDLPVLMEVPDAGALAGLSRYGSYRAAKDGALPTLKVGNRLRVPTCAWLDKLGLRYEAVTP